jgi:hypothetical protein
LNVTAEREEHPAKHASQSRSTADGMQIDESDEHRQNARVEIRGSREPGSKVTAERD